MTHRFEESEKNVQQYPFHQFWFDQEKLEGDLQRFKSFKSEVISAIGLQILSNLRSLSSLNLALKIGCHYPSGRHPRLVLFDQDRNPIERKHASTEQISYFLALKLVNSSDEKFFQKYFEIISKSYLLNLKSCLSKIQKDKQKTILFITRRCFFVVKKIARELRKKGHICVLITIEDLVNQDDYKDSFDILLGGLDNYLFLSHVIKSLKVDLFYIQCMMWDYGLAKIVDSQRNASKLVCEFYDITGIYASTDKLKLLWSSNQVDGDLYFEDFIFDNADLVLSRFSHSIIQEYRGKPVIHHAEVQPTISRAKVIKKVPYEIVSNPTRLVYLGNLIPRNEHHPQCLFPLWGMPEAWQLLLEQKFEIHVYNSPFRSLKEPGMAPIVNLSRTFSNLHFYEGLPHEEIIDEITKFDFGINLSVVDFRKNQNGKLLWRGAVGTKIFTYLEGGLPVLVNKEFESMSSFISANNLGYAISSNEIHELSKKLGKIDYKEIRDNVSKFNEQNTFERFNSKALGMLDELLR